VASDRREQARRAEDVELTGVCRVDVGEAVVTHAKTGAAGGEQHAAWRSGVEEVAGEGVGVGEGGGYAVPVDFTATGRLLAPRRAIERCAEQGAVLRHGRRDVAARAYNLRVPFLFESLAGSERRGGSHHAWAGVVTGGEEQSSQHRRSEERRVGKEGKCAEA